MKTTRRRLLQALGVAPAAGLIESLPAVEIPCPAEQELISMPEVIVGHVFAKTPFEKRRVKIFVETAYRTMIKDCSQCGQTHSVLMEPEWFEMNESLCPWKTRDGSLILAPPGPSIAFPFYTDNCRVLINGQRVFPNPDETTRCPDYGYLHTNFYV